MNTVKRVRHPARDPGRDHDREHDHEALLRATRAELTKAKQEFSDVAAKALRGEASADETGAVLARVNAAMQKLRELQTGRQGETR